MTQEDRLTHLIEALLSEKAEYRAVTIPDSEEDRKGLFRALMNVRPPEPIEEEFLLMQDAYLAEERDRKGIVLAESLSPAEKGIYLWQGDITALRADAIVNAANPALLGCFIPGHGCIDNAIHSAAGVQLRLACHHLMKQQGGEEETGTAKITEAFNLPCRYVIHTVGPVIQGGLREEDCRLLSSCYRSCLELADSRGLKNMTFCCISTGEYHFPNEAAARIAIDTVRKYREENRSELEVIFNVYKDKDFGIYQRLLGTDGRS